MAQPVRAKVIAASLLVIATAIIAKPASALVPQANSPLQHQFKQDSSVIEVAAGRGGAVVRPGYAGGGVRWARPARYVWPRGGAIAAGAAIGFVTAATAAAWAGSPPAPGMCWYYTDPSRTQGFWDYCQ